MKKRRKNAFNSIKTRKIRIYFEKTRKKRKKHEKYAKKDVLLKKV